MVLFKKCKYRKLNTSHKMKNINNKSFFNFIKSKGLILISSSFLLTSCVIYTGGYSETDGVYYDPNKDSLPAGSYSGNYGNQVDDYYNYQDTYPSLYDNNQQNIQEQKNRYSLSSDSDWGTFTGSETNYTSFNNWGWGGGFGWGGWGYPNYGWGWNGGFNSFGWGMGFGWGWGSSFYSPWGWGGFYDPFWGYGYGGWGGYYGGFYGYPYYGNGYYRPVYHRSGANGSRLSGMLPQGSGRNNGLRGINSTAGFRTPQSIAGVNNGNIRNNNIRIPNNSGGGRNPNIINGGVRQYPNNGGIRNSYPNNGGIRSQSNYPNNGSIRQQNNGGFRNDSYNAPTRSGGNSGGFNSGGGMRSGGSGGGGMRSGGGRR